MHRIDVASAAAVLPSPAPVGTPGYFTEGNPLTSTPPTVVSADIMNALQEEVGRAIEAQGLTLDKGDNGQLAKALGRLAGGTGNLIINPEGRIRQRLGSATGNAGSSETLLAGGPDHWRARAGGSGDVGTVSPGSDNTADDTAGWPSRPQTRIRFQKTTNNNTGVNPTLCQFVEDIHFLAGQPVVLAFDGKKNSGADLAVTGVDIVQDFGTGSGSSDVTTALTAIGAVTLDGSARRFIYVGTLPTINGKDIDPGAHLKVRVKFATNQTFDVFLSAFVLARGSIDAGYAPRRKELELFFCQRYYELNSLNFNEAACDKGLWDMAFSRVAGDVETLQQRWQVPKFEGAGGGFSVTWYAHDGSADFITEGASTKHAVTSVVLGGLDTGYPRITTPPLGAVLRFFRAFWLVQAEIPD